MVQLVLVHADQHPKLSLQVSKSLLPLHTHAAFFTSLELLFCPIDLDEQLLSNNTLLGLVKVLVEILVRNHQFVTLIFRNDMIFEILIGFSKKAR